MKDLLLVREILLDTSLILRLPMDSLEQPPPYKVVEVMKCRIHSSQAVDHILNDSKNTDVFKCLLYIEDNTSLVLKVISISTILAEENDSIALNLCCDERGLYKDA